VSGDWERSSDGGPLRLLPSGPVGSGNGARPAVFLDRDGVINELVPDPVTGNGESPLRLEEVRLLPGAALAAGHIARFGYALVCVSNQPAAAKGTVSVAQLKAVHERVIELLAMEDVKLEASYLCLHHPDGVVAGLSGPCDCRKPSSGMLEAAAGALGLDLKESWMVGDTDADMAAGISAGCRTLLVRNPGSVHKRLRAFSPGVIADSLLDGVKNIQEE
jgi:D-glycero-D-manno-heptose 1,7-bisphosphate phosphatase